MLYDYSLDMWSLGSFACDLMSLLLSTSLLHTVHQTASHFLVFVLARLYACWTDVSKRALLCGC